MLVPDFAADMRSHPKKWHLLRPDAAPRGDSLYIQWLQFLKNHYIELHSYTQLFSIISRTVDILCWSCQRCCGVDTVVRFPGQMRSRSCPDHWPVWPVWPVSPVTGVLLSDCCRHTETPRHRPRHWSSRVEGGGWFNPSAPLSRVIFFSSSCMSVPPVVD